MKVVVNWLFSSAILDFDFTVILLSAVRNMTSGYHMGFYLLEPVYSSLTINLKFIAGVKVDNYKKSTDLPVALNVVSVLPLKHT